MTVSNSRILRGPSIRRADIRGFTLIELLISVAVAAILLAAASPSFTSMINTNRLATLSNDVLASLQTARMEAMRRGVPTLVCRSTDGATCAAGTRWRGWLVFADANNNGLPSAAEILRYETVGSSVELWVSPAISSSNRIRFRPDGLTYDNSNVLLAATLAACVRSSQPADNVRDIGIRAGSRFEVGKRNASGACAAPGNS